MEEPLPPRIITGFLQMASEFFMSAHFLTRIEKSTAQDMCRANVPLVCEAQKVFRETVELPPNADMPFILKVGTHCPREIRNSYNFDLGQLLPTPGRKW